MRIILYGLLVFFNFQLFGQDNDTLKVSDVTPSILDGLTLESITVFGRDQSKASSFSNKIEQIDAKQIALSQSQTVADVLSSNASVFVQKSQLGGGSPVIRGFEANRLLLVVDGVRMNNAIYRSGHLQNAISIDPSSLDKVEILFGPSSLIYGSDALGGVIHFKTKKPVLYFGEDRLNVKTMTYYRNSSANREHTLHHDINIATSKVASLTSLSYSKFGNLRTGKRYSRKYPDYGKQFYYVSRENAIDRLVVNDKPHLQIGTQYNQFDLVQKVKYSINNEDHIGVNFQYSETSDVPRYDALTEPNPMGGLNYAEWYYGPQKRLLSSVRYMSSRSNKVFDHFLAIASHQAITESRNIRRFSSEQKTNNIENVGIYSLTLDAKKNINKWEYKMGAQFSRNYVSSNGTLENVILDTPDQITFSRYPSGGGKTKAIELYTVLSRKISNKSRVNGGVRFSNNKVSLKYNQSDPIEWPEIFYDGFNNTNNSLSYNLGYNQKILSSWNLKMGLSSAFKTPNIDDLAKIRVKANEISTPNLYLKPERATTFETSLKYDKSKFGLEGNAYITKVQNIIVRRPFPFPNGERFLSNEGNILIAFGNVNEDNGMITGGALTGYIKKGDFQFLSSLTITKGLSYKDDSSITQPLAHIPPLFGWNSFAYRSDVFGATIKHIYNGKKPLDQFGGIVDNPEFSSPEGALAWSTYNLNFDYKVSTKRGHIYTFLFGVENIMDKHYRLFSSGISAPGRNYIFTLKAEI